MDFHIIINILVIGLIVALLSFLYAKISNKIIINKNNATNIWANIVKEINIRFNLIDQLNTAASAVLDDTLKNELTRVSQNYATKVAIEDIINAYYDANAVINTVMAKLNNQEWITAFNDSFNRIEALRKEYNDTILKINNSVKMFPTSIIAKMNKITPWLFFRGTE